MKLNVGRTLLLGFGFFGISVLWAIHDSYVPIFLNQNFGLDASATGFIITLVLVITFLLQPSIGSLSDRTHTRFGRRIPFIIVFAPLAAIGFAILPVLVQPGALWLFVAVLILTIIALAFFRIPVIALMPDITPSPFRSQANGLINLMGGLGAILAFVGGSFLFKLNPLFAFLAASILLVVGCAIVFVTIHEPQDATTQAVESRPGLIASLRAVIGAPEKSALYLLLAIFSWFVGYNAVSKFFTLYGTNTLKLQPNNASFLLAYLSIAFVVFAVPSGYLAGKFGRRRVILCGLALISGLAITVRLLPVELLASGWLLPGLLIVLGVAWALINVNSLAMVVDVAPQNELATYTGLYYFASTSAAVVGPAMAGFLIDASGKDYSTIFLIAVVAFVIAFGFMLGVRRGERAEQAAVPAPAE